MSQTFRYKQVMLLDDDDLDNFVNKKIIETAGFSNRVYVSTTGKNALEFLKNLCASHEEYQNIYPEVIFVDINMPMMDGFQFLEYFIRKHTNDLRHCKLVILTSSVNEGDRDRLKAISNEIVFINKPLSQDLLETI